MKRLLIVSLVAAVAISGVFGVFMERADAQEEYLPTLLNIWYDLDGTKLDDCVTCHEAGATTLNPYGLDLNAAMLSNGTEITNALWMSDGLDSDVDGVVNYDELKLVTFPGDPTDYPLCADNDGDGVTNYGWKLSCVTSEIDCNDNDAAMFPGNTEICNDAKDNDCDGQIDAADSDCASWVCAENDLDGDGFSTYGDWCGPVDCNDGDATIFPGACDIKRDGIDQNCDGVDRTTGPPCK